MPHKKYPAIIYKTNRAPEIEITIPQALVDMVMKEKGPALHVFIEKEEYEPDFKTALELKEEDSTTGEYIAKYGDQDNNNIKFSREGKKFKCQCGLVYKSLLNLGRHYETKHLEDGKK